MPRFSNNSPYHSKISSIKISLSSAAALISIVNPSITTMKTIAKSILLLVLLSGLQASLFGQDNKAGEEQPRQPQYIATIKRSTSGQKLDDRGFGAGSVSLQSGMVYPVEKQDMGSVTIRDGDALIRVNKSDVELAEDDGSAAEGGFFRIVSANYQATTGGRRYSVKQEILKRIPKGPITQPIKILIDDHLLRARAQEVNIQYGTIDGNNNVTLDAPKIMMLTIIYEYEGKRFTKEVTEGNYLVLP